MINKTRLALVLVAGAGLFMILTGGESDPAATSPHSHSNRVPIEHPSMKLNPIYKEKVDASEDPTQLKTETLADLKTQVAEKTKELRNLGYPNNANRLIPGTQKYKKILSLLVDRENLKEKILEIHLHGTRKVIEDIEV